MNSTVEKPQLYSLYGLSFSGVDEEWRNNYCSKREECTIKKSKTGSVFIHTLLFLRTTPFLNPTLIKRKFNFVTTNHILFHKSFFFLSSFLLLENDFISFKYTERTKRRHSERSRRCKGDHDAAHVTDVNNYRYAWFISHGCYEISINLLFYYWVFFLLYAEYLLQLGM